VAEKAGTKGFTAIRVRDKGSCTNLRGGTSGAMRWRTDRGTEIEKGRAHVASFNRKITTNEKQLTCVFGDHIRARGGKRYAIDITSLNLFEERNGSKNTGKSGTAGAASKAITTEEGTASVTEERIGSLKDGGGGRGRGGNRPDVEGRLGEDAASRWSAIRKGVLEKGPKQALAKEKTDRIEKGKRNGMPKTLEALSRALQKDWQRKSNKRRTETVKKEAS